MKAGCWDQDGAEWLPLGRFRGVDEIAPPEGIALFAAAFRPNGIGFDWKSTPKVRSPIFHALSHSTNPEGLKRDSKPTIGMSASKVMAPYGPPAGEIWT
jgi:hypothetical protein